MKRLAISLLYATGWLVGGCATYQTLPLTSDAVNYALRMPTAAELVDRAASLHNPLIRSAGFDPHEGLTPNGAAVLAVLGNPTLYADRHRTAVADSQLLQAGILPNPSMSYGVDIPIGRNTGGEVVGYGLGLQWEITSLIARDARVEGAAAAGEQVRLDVAWKEWRVAQAARQAAYDAIAMRAREADATWLAAQLGRIAERAQAALSGHDVTAAQAASAIAAAGEARIALASARRDRRDAELALRQAAGIPADAPLRLAADVALPSRLTVGSAESLTANLENRRIDLAALRRGYDSQESAVRAAVLSQFPKIAIGISHTRDTGDFLTLGPSISADLPFFDRNQGNIGIARATRQQLFDEYVARVFEARWEVVRGVDSIESLNELIGEQARQVATLRAIVDANERALAQGNIDLTAFYAAAVDLSQKQSDLTKLKQELVRALISLELATGAHLDDALAGEAPRPEPSQ